MLADSPVITQVPARDLERARKFYSEILGLKVIEAVLYSVVVLEAGQGTRLMLFHTPDYTPSDHAHAQFFVSDLRALVAKLKSKGIELIQYHSGGIKTNNEGIASVGPAMVAWFRDSEGNLVALLQRIEE